MEIAVVSQKHSLKKTQVFALEQQKPGESIKACRKECRVKDDQAFFERLIVPIKHRMMSSIWRVVRNAEAAEDTFQDALTTIWRKRKRIQDHPKPEALILKICLNAAYDNLRKSKHHLKNLNMETIPQISTPPADEASEQLAGKKTEAEVLSAIGQLPRSQALSVLMRVIQGHSYREISETLGCSETTARIHVSRARTKLSYQLKHLLPILESGEGRMRQTTFIKGKGK